MINAKPSMTMAPKTEDEFFRCRRAIMGPFFVFAEANASSVDPNLSNTKSCKPGATTPSKTFKIRFGPRFVNGNQRKRKDPRGSSCKCLQGRDNRL